MKTLLKNCKMINVFSHKIVDTNILLDEDIILGFGDYTDSEADKIIDANSKYVAPGFIDGHIHIESTMLEPFEFAKIAIKHGTAMVICDPHEITNVCGTFGIDYILEATKGLPLVFNIMLPSCVPATSFDESFKPFTAKEMEPYYNKERILGLAEMMNYPGVLFNDPEVFAKINCAKKLNKAIDGHAPLLTGKQLNLYISAGIKTDHEASTFDEAFEKASKGQWIMIREGTAARNLNNLAPMIKSELKNRCLFSTDDKEPDDLIENGHIDSIIRKAISLGYDPIDCIQIATINAANCYRLDNIGAIAPGYKANLVFFNDINKIDITDVFANGKRVVENGILIDLKKPSISKELLDSVYNSFHIQPITQDDLLIKEKGIHQCRVIKAIPGEIITEELDTNINFDINNGIDISKDILKIAVCERHNNTGHIGLAYINGIGLKSGAIASSVSHDSHNIICIGTNDKDIASAINRIIEIGGGNVLVDDNKVIGELALPIAGLMSDKDIAALAKEIKETRGKAKLLGVNEGIAPFMNMSFISLPVIPNLKITTIGLFDVNKFSLVPLIIK